eukprot:gene1272-1440_t
MTHGLPKLKRAIVSGNYHKQEGVGFGGFRLSASNRNLVAFLQDLGLGHGHGSRRASPEAEGDSSTPKEGIAGETVAEKSATASVRRIHVIDVHTGLGPPGVDSLASKSVTVDQLEEIFPTERDCKSNKATGALKDSFQSPGDSNSAFSGYDLTVGDTCGGLTRSFLAPHLTGEDKLCVIQ